MSEDRLERLVRAAVRGIMEAVLSVDTETGVDRIADSVSSVPTSPPYLCDLCGTRDPQSHFSSCAEAAYAAGQRSAQEMPFPSVTKAQDELFGVPMPRGNDDLDQALETVARVRQQQERDARPDVQPGPGETEVAEWLRVPQS